MKILKYMIAIAALLTATACNGKKTVSETQEASIEQTAQQIDTTYEYSKDYMTCIEEAKQELREQARPEVKNPLESIDEYDTIILGYPNWWGTMPMVVYTFLESYDFTGKTIIPFCTNEGSGMGSSVRFIKKLCPGANVDDGTPIHGAEAANADRQAREIADLAQE